MIVNELSPVLLIDNVNFNNITMKMLYNLFSNFGNLTKTLLLKTKQQALLEYQTISQSTLAKEYLNNLNI
jgi:hypothetical protein